MQFYDACKVTVYSHGVSGNKEPFVDISDEMIMTALQRLLDVRYHPVLIHCNQVCAKPNMNNPGQQSGSFALSFIEVHTVNTLLKYESCPGKAPDWELGGMPSRHESLVYDCHL